MKILMTLSNPFVSDARVYQESRSLINAGHEVTILAFDAKATRLKRREEIDGIRVHRLHPSRGHQRVSRILEKFDGIPILEKLAGGHDLWVMRNSWKRMSELGLKGDFDVVHCHDLDTLPAGTLLKKKTGIPLIYDSHEIFHWMVSGWLPGFLVRHFSRLERKLAPKADHVVTVTPFHAKHFRKMGCRDVTVVTNCKRMRKTQYQPLPDSPPYKMLYIGVLKTGRMIVQAMKVCHDLEDWKMKVGGYGHLEREVGKYEGQGVEFMGRVDPDKVLDHTYDAHLVLATYDPSNKNNRIGPSNKLFEAMACGRPCVVSKGTYPSSVAKSEDCGYAIDYSPRALKELLEALARDPDDMERKGMNALKAAKKRYNWKVQEGKLLKIYEELAGS